MVYAVEINSSIFPAARISNISTLLNLVLPLVMGGAGLVCLMMALYAAFNIMTHGDNPEALKKYYASMVFAIVGLLIVIASFLIVRVIGIMIGNSNLIPQ